MEMNVHPMKHLGEPNKERAGDDCMQGKRALSVEFTSPQHCGVVLLENKF